ncbi:ribosomal protein S6 modification protein-like protein [Alcanivorax hongdengensis A-11-3]|uniref:Ribosomal protein S6 modification protein-like protein n=1 Tax=Alcanivorax hongdengensis A-11-3 TaxID=1177179 RepID=L0WAC2_9GAMM|nr:RimK family protein [Alcanivorax hongdengensis]EKF73891.1 ribosomal protein S6 modification protein-like protein [Alcanivorax hongdengensis A-11-3]
MSQVIILVDDPADWAAYYPTRHLLSARDYLQAAQSVCTDKQVQVINLCRSYKYLSPGYYCSLLAEARGQRVLPSVRTVNDLSRKSLYGLHFEHLETVLDKAMKKQGSDASRFTLTLYFGHTEQEGLAELGRQIFDQLPCPVLKVEFRRREQWQIVALKPLSLKQLKGAQEDEFARALEQFNARVWRNPRRRRGDRYELAMLVNEQEAMPPSNRKALKQFIRAGRQLGIKVETVGREAYTHLGEYDGLFIRETTALDHYTYQFARKAEQEGMVVIDDPGSILRCTNKIYLAELMQSSGVPVPSTAFVFSDEEEQVDHLIEELALPMVLKIPDGSFSRGISKVETREELKAALGGYLKQSAVVLAQAFMYTDYDWRIGVLNNRPLFACQYFMSKGHWQIYNHQSSGKTTSGNSRTVPVHEVPPKVLKMALKAARLMGNGLYGVDLKQTGDQIVVMEVNDNPNVDAGVEDAWLGEDLYRQIMLEFLRRLEAKRLGLPL